MPTCENCKKRITCKAYQENLTDPTKFLFGCSGKADFDELLRDALKDNDMLSGYNNPVCDLFDTCEECQQATGGCKEYSDYGVNPD